MLCYFDSDTDVNLHYIKQIKNVRPLDRLKSRLSNSNFTFVTSKDYTESGLYVIEVSMNPSLWCAQTFAGSDNILLNIPGKTLKAAKNKKIRILIISAIEGDNFVNATFDGYMHLNNTMKLLGMPKHSLVVITGNLNAAVQYTQWCKKHNEEELIEFIGGIDWDGKEATLPNMPLSTMVTNFALPFNSLNRAHRPHRSEHLFYLADRNLTGRVSGGAWFAEGTIDKPIYQDVNYDYYKKQLLTHYPQIIDLSVADLKQPKDTHPSLTNNFEIYISSMLTLVTESHYDQDGGMFITEKTMRPLAVGHPFMILGQCGILEKLKALGFKTEFDGLDGSYDSIEDNRLRFLKFHDTLLNWCNKNPRDRFDLLQKWQSTIEHNFKIYKSINFKKLMFDCAIDSTKRYFKEDF